METIHSAAKKGSIRLLKKILSRGTPVDSPDHYKETPLVIAAKNKNIRAVKFLVTQGADINTKTSWEGLSPLHMFSLSNSLEMCTFLADNGADIHAKDKYGRGVCELVCTGEARKKKEERLLLLCYFCEHGAEPGYALHKAAYYGHVNIISFLLQQRADPDALNQEGATPLHKAVTGDQPEAVKFLLEHGADPLQKDSAGNSLLHVLRYKSTSIGEMLLAAGLSINIRNSEGQTPIFLAIGGPQEFFDFCMEHNADLEAVDTSGHTPLHMASIATNPEAIKILLEKGVQVNPLDKKHKTPLDYAGSLADNTAGYDEFMAGDLCKDLLKKYGGKSGTST
jgi:ankyrin repeat domain-containing protein 50